MGWIGGQGAIEMEKLSDHEIADECMKLIRTFLRDSSLPNPSKFRCSRWNSNLYVRGAYSYTSKKTDHIQNWEQVLSRPIVYEPLSGSDRNIIVLAGEHCHEQYFSTVHGAFLSGIEQARKILSLRKELKKTCSCLSKL